MPHLIEFDEILEQISDIKYPKFKDNPGNIGLSNVVAIPNGSLIIFGATTGAVYPFVPLVVELAPDQSVAARYEIHGLNENGFSAGMPTANPGEYVAIRPVLREKSTIAMTFLRRN